MMISFLKTLHDYGWEEKTWIDEAISMFDCEAWRDLVALVIYSSFSNFSVSRLHAFFSDSSPWNSWMKLLDWIGLELLDWSYWIEAIGQEDNACFAKPRCDVVKILCPDSCLLIFWRLCLCELMCFLRLTNHAQAQFNIFNQFLWIDTNFNSVKFIQLVIQSSSTLHSYNCITSPSHQNWIRVFDFHFFHSYILVKHRTKANVSFLVCESLYLCWEKEFSKFFIRSKSSNVFGINLFTYYI